MKYVTEITSVLTLGGLDLEPAQCSSILPTTVTDVADFFAITGFTVVFQSPLM